MRGAVDLSTHPLSKLSQVEFEQVIAKRRTIRMSNIDALSAEWRELVHEFGFTIVCALRQCGVIQAKHAKHIILTVRDELSPTRGSFSNQGSRNQIDNRMAFIPCEPTDAMIDASMATVSGHDVSVTKREKHRLRLRAAIDAARGVKRSSAVSA